MTPSRTWRSVNGSIILCSSAILRIQRSGLTDIHASCFLRAALVLQKIFRAKPEGAGVSRVKAEQAVETVFESLKNAMGRGQRIELRRFGVFSVRPRKTGIGRNPRTGEEVNIPPGKAVRFKPGKELQGLEESAKI